jgi:hypothetical protein
MEHGTFKGSTYQFCDTYRNTESRDANTRHSEGVQKEVFNGMRMLFLLIFSKLFDLHNVYLSENSTYAVSTETRGEYVVVFHWLLGCIFETVIEDKRLNY